jgi:hypothetical protein
MGSSAAAWAAGRRAALMQRSFSEADVNGILVVTADQTTWLFSSKKAMKAAFCSAALSADFTKPLFECDMQKLLQP